MTTSELSADEVLTTTRAIRRKLDLARPVPQELVRECLEIALQAPTGTNRQNWHFVVVTEPDTKAALGDIYRRGGELVRAETDRPAPITPADAEAWTAQTQRVLSSSEYLFQHIQDVPGMLIPCIAGRPSGRSAATSATHVGSVIQATWSFMLAARARRIGTVWTTVHLALEKEAAAVLGIPYPDVMQVALIPFGFVVGDPFKPARREPLELVTHWERW
jgi:nitroreductase